MTRYDGPRRLYDVRQVLPREGRERKRLHKRWIVLAAGTSEALAKVQATMSLLDANHEILLPRHDSCAAAGFCAAWYVGAAARCAVVVAPGLLGVWS